MLIGPRSHLDHGLSMDHIRFIFEVFGDRDCFFKETVELPEHLEDLLCGIHGPVVGDNPVDESEVFYLRRGDRAKPSRMVSRPNRKTRMLTVIAGPNRDCSCVLYTAFGGPCAEREPWDPNIADEEEQTRCDLFWSQHALSAE